MSGKNLRDSSKPCFICSRKITVNVYVLTKFTYYSRPFDFVEIYIIQVEDLAMKIPHFIKVLTLYIRFPQYWRDNNTRSNSINT